MNNRSGIEFLTKIYNDLQNEEIVKHTSSPSDNKYEAIEKYMDRLERITERAYQNENDINLLKRLYHDKYVIKEENVPEAYFEKQEQIALERGYGHVKYTERIKQQEIEQIRKEQHVSPYRDNKEFTQYIKDGIYDINNYCGTEIDYTTDLKARRLLINYVMYADNKRLAEFKTLYIGDYDELQRQYYIGFKNSNV